MTTSDNQNNENIIIREIQDRKAELADNILILCHHYQEDRIYQFADLTGDSLKLARQAAQADKPEYFIFCGVHFMAESADILTGADQKVLLPDAEAGCPMADMATGPEVEAAWQELLTVDNSFQVVPVTYVNSFAAVKAFVGEKGGSVCTSSNAEKVLRWALSRGDKAFFFPDEHLGRNSARALGIAEDEIAVWQRDKVLGGNSEDQIRRAWVILWTGFCRVHMEFSAAQVDYWRRKEPGIKVIVHPECRHEVVQSADMYGSTEGIIAALENSEPGSKWAVGTEVNLVKRLIKKHTDKEVHLLSRDSPCKCTTMARITPRALLQTLNSIKEGHPRGQVSVAPEVADKARLSLNRMLDIT
ncbi:MAG: quinolinate synthase NadA [Thermodesulfobacteriota bacterium]